MSRTPRPSVAILIMRLKMQMLSDVTITSRPTWGGCKVVRVGEPSVSCKCLHDKCCIVDRIKFIFFLIKQFDYAVMSVQNSR